MYKNSQVYGNKGWGESLDRAICINNSNSKIIFKF